MDFKKSYKFVIFFPFIIMLSIFLAGLIALIIWMIVDGILNDRFNDIILALILCVISFAGSLVLILILCQWVTIDEEKIELKVLKGTVLSFYIGDIYKIEKKPGGKGTLVFVIHGSTPQTSSRKNKVKTISFFADKKKEKILRHFITNPDVWKTESNI